MSDDIRVFAPSYKRGNKKAVTQSYLPFCTLVVAGSEAEEYQRAGNRVVVCPDKVQGNLCRVRNWILDQNRDARGVLLLDDDLRGVGRWNKQKLEWLTASECEDFFEKGFALAEQWGAFLWGINVTVDKGIYREGVPFTTVRYVGGPFQAHRPNPIRYDEALPLKEDYDITLQHLARYRVALRWSAYCYDSLQHEQTGGCAAYRSQDKERQQFEALQKKWGSDIIRVDHGNDKEKVRSKRQKGYDLNPILKPPIDGV